MALSKEDRINLAIESIKSNDETQKMYIRKAAATHGILYTTLSNRFHNRNRAIRGKPVALSKILTFSRNF